MPPLVFCVCLRVLFPMVFCAFRSPLLMFCIFIWFCVSSIVCFVFFPRSSVVSTPLGPFCRPFSPLPLMRFLFLGPPYLLVILPFLPFLLLFLCLWSRYDRYSLVVFLISTAGFQNRFPPIPIPHQVLPFHFLPDIPYTFYVALGLRHAGTFSRILGI